MKDTIGLLVNLSNANSLICKQKQAIEKMQVEIDRLRCQTKEAIIWRNGITKL